MLVWLSGSDECVYCGFGFVLHLVAGLTLGLVVCLCTGLVWAGLAIGFGVWVASCAHVMSLRVRFWWFVVVVGVDCV